MNLGPILPTLDRLTAHKMDTKMNTTTTSTRRSPMSYFSLSSLMGKDRQKANFRRFNKLTMLNLLRLQVELHSLEEVIRETLDGGKDFYTLEYSEEPRDKLAWMYIKSLEEKLGNYRMDSSARLNP